MRYLVGAVMMICAGALSSAATANNPCSTDMYKRADASLAIAAREWSSLFAHYNTFGTCYDGALAEGYSDAVVSLLAHRWDRFDALIGLWAQNPDFRRWMIGHIDTTAGSEELTKVVRNAAECTGSTTTQSFCRDVAEAAKDALTQLPEP